MNTTKLYRFSELAQKARKHAIVQERIERMKKATPEYFKPLLEEAVNTWGKKAGFNIKVSNIRYDVSGAPGTGLSFTSDKIDVVKTLKFASLVFPKSAGVIDYIRESEQFDYVIKNDKFTIERDYEESTMYAVSCNITFTDDCNDDEDTRLDRFDIAEDIESFVDKVKNYLCEIMFNKVAESFYYLISDESIIQVLEDRQFTVDGEKI